MRFRSSIHRLLRAESFVIACLVLLEVIACHGESQAPNRLLEGSGVAPFGTPDAVELCFDRARLTPRRRSSDPAFGLCVPEQNEPMECGHEDECDVRERCVCGRCVLQLCAFSTDCRSGDVCVGAPSRCASRCATRHDCPASSICQQGACIPSCGDAGDCAYGELCLVGRCVALGCGEETEVCASTERCDLQRRLGTVAVPTVNHDPANGLILYGFWEHSPRETQLIRGTSRDGRRFDFYIVEGIDVSELQAQSRLGFLWHDEQVALYYAKQDNQGIFRSRSSDGLRFFDDATPIVIQGVSNDPGVLRSPSPVSIEGESWLAMANHEANIIVLAVAIDEEATVYEQQATFRVSDIVPDEHPESLWRDITEIAEPYPSLYINDFGRRELRVFFTGLGSERLGDGSGSFAEPNYSIGLAVWDIATHAAEPSFRTYRYNPVLAGRGNLRALTERSASVVFLDGAWLMYYTDGETLRVARNPPER